MIADRPFLCGTRALKNLRWLRAHAPNVFEGQEPALGWGSVVPTRLLGSLNRALPTTAPKFIDPDQLRRVSFPEVTDSLSEPIFRGTVHFLQVNFTVNEPGLPSQNAVVSLADMQTATSYATQAAPLIAGYTQQYGATAITVSSTILTFNVTLTQPSYSDSDLQTWINDVKAANQISATDCIAMLHPVGFVTNVDGDPSQGVGGYHGKADLAYIFVNVFGTNLTVADDSSQYAIALSLAN